MKTWTPEEEGILVNRVSEGLKKLIELLPAKSASSIYCKASKMGVSIPHVTEYDRMGSELENKKWMWENRILPVLIKNGKCMEWHGSNSKGYGQIRFFVAGKNRIFSTHRIAWEVANGELLNPLINGCHTCDNPKCNNPSHIFHGTQSDNVHDMHIKGKARGMFKKGQKPHANNVRGERVPHSKLTDVKVMEARVIHEAGLLGYKLLAKRAGVTNQIMHRALKRRGWRHVPEPTQEQRHNILSEYLKHNPAKPKRYGTTIRV